MKFDPMAPWAQFFETWQKIAADSTTRAQSFFAEIEKFETQRIQRTESAIEEMAKLQKDTLAYSAQLAAEWRRMSLEAFQKAASFNPAAAA
jgi:hypothetical protein